MIRSWGYLLVALIMVGAWGIAYAIRPIPSIDSKSVSLERQIPSEFGDWRELRTGLVQVDLAPRNDEGTLETGIDWPYDQTLTRVYKRSDGEMVMFALAWGSKQRQEIKIHRPELCYTAQGFQLVQRSQAPIAVTPDITIPATRLVTKGQSRKELVTYWVRIGDRVSMSAMQSRMQILKTGLTGTIPDGILFRVSQSRSAQDADAEKSYAVQASFIKDLLVHVDQPTTRLLVGSPSAE